MTIQFMAVKAFTMVYTKFESNILNIYLSKSLHYSESELNLDNLFLGPQSTQSIADPYTGSRASQYKSPYVTYHFRDANVNLYIKKMFWK